MRLRVLAAVTVLGAGCGSVSDKSNSPDASIDATDTRPPMILSSHPGQDEKSVSPLSAMSIHFDEALDMSTVSAATVHAKYVSKPGFYDLLGFEKLENAGSVEGTVSYVADEKKIVFAPLQPLPINAHIDLALDGVKDMAGVAMPATHLTFETIINADKYWVFYTNQGISIGNYIDFTVMNGQQTRYWTANNPGADQIWFTADDPHAGRFDMRFDANGRLTVADIFQAGTDGVYGTADDVEYQSVTITYDAAGHTTSMAINSAIGPDNVWGTADDIPSTLIVATWQGDNFIGMIPYYDKGLDGVWRTADDKVNTGITFTKYTYDAQNHRTRQVDYQPGADQLPGTADDIVLRYFDITNDAHGFVTQSVRKDKGTDGIWFNADDVVNGYTKYTRDARGLATETFAYLNASSAGTDAMFMTADDVPSQHITDAFGTTGQLTQETNWAAGTDAILGTADDVPMNYQKYSYETTGARISQTSFGNPGPDTMWNTADDVFTNIYSYDLTR